MAYKIFTDAKPFLKADIRPFNVTEMRMLTMKQSQYKKKFLWYKILGPEID
jgi:hypothetical protein